MRVVQCVDAAGDDHIAVVGFQLSYARLDRGQRGGARGVHGVVRPAEIETVGNPAGRYIPDNSRKGVLGPVRKFLLKVICDRIGIFIEEERKSRAKSVEPGELARAPAEAQDHRGAIAGKRALQVVGVFECRINGFQGQELERLDGRK